MGEYKWKELWEALLISIYTTKCERESWDELIQGQKHLSLSRKKEQLKHFSPSVFQEEVCGGDHGRVSGPANKLELMITKNLA